MIVAIQVIGILIGIVVLMCIFVKLMYVYDIDVGMGAPYVDIMRDHFEREKYKLSEKEYECQYRQWCLESGHKYNGKKDDYAKGDGWRLIN